MYIIVVAWPGTARRLGVKCLSEETTSARAQNREIGNLRPMLATLRGGRIHGETAIAENLSPRRRYLRALPRSADERAPCPFDTVLLL